VQLHAGSWGIPRANIVSLLYLEATRTVIIGCPYEHDTAIT
jgi:hypothetical protein